MDTEDKPLSKQISELGVYIVPLQSHEYKLNKWYLLTDALSGQIIEDDRSEKVVELLQNENVSFDEKDSRIIVSDPNMVPVIQEIVDTHEYRYKEHFHSGQIISVSNVMEHTDTEKQAMYEAIALAGKWKNSDGGLLTIELRSLSKPVGELIHLLNTVDAHFFCEHINHSDLLNVSDVTTINQIQQARANVIKRIGFDHPEIKDMQNRIRDLIMFAQSVHIGAELTPEKTPDMPFSKAADKNT